MQAKSVLSGDTLHPPDVVPDKCERGRRNAQRAPSQLLGVRRPQYGLNTYYERSLAIFAPRPRSPGDHHDRLLRGRGLDRCRLRRRRFKLVQRRFPFGVRRPQPDHAQHRRGDQLQHYPHPFLYTGMHVNALEREVDVLVHLCTMPSMR